MNLDEFQQRGQRIHDAGLFVGCALERFAATSRVLFDTALELGLQRDHNVLEVGCGCLRSGYWFIEHLAAGRYCGIEPNRPMLDAGREILLGELEAQRRPAFDGNDQFELGAFERSFDWIVAFSVWSHAAKWQVSKMIEYAGAQRSRLLCSFVPTQPDKPDYAGNAWVGKSHLNSEKGTVAHDPANLLAECRAAGLEPYLLRQATVSQLWIYCVPHAPAATDATGAG